MTESKPRKRDAEKERYWRNQVERWKASGFSQMEFCRREDLNFHTFSSWTSIIRLRDLESLQEKNRAAGRTPGGQRKTAAPEAAARKKNNVLAKNQKIKGALFVKATVEDEDDKDRIAGLAMRNGVVSKDKAPPTSSVAAELYRSDLSATIRIYNGADAATVSALVSAFASC